MVMRPDPRTKKNRTQQLPYVGYVYRAVAQSLTSDALMVARGSTVLSRRAGSVRVLWVAREEVVVDLKV